MPWYQVLPLGILGGVICGGFFYLLGWLMDKRDDRRWARELEERPALPRRIVKQRDGWHDADGS